MEQIDLHLTIGQWKSKHSSRIFEDWAAISIPFPAKNKLPEWHKSTPVLNNEQRTIKKCMPVTDMLTAGYLLPAPVDIRMIRSENDGIQFTPSDNSEFFVTKHDPIQYDKLSWRDNCVIKFDLPWIFKTPPGWSMLYTAPAYRDHSKLEALSAIVETDTYYNNVNCPVRVKDWKVGEELVIPKGTPLVQAIPFKREEFKLNMSQVDWREIYSTAIDLAKNPSAYRDKFRQKKKFT